MKKYSLLLIFAVLTNYALAQNKDTVNLSTVDIKAIYQSPVEKLPASSESLSGAALNTKGMYSPERSLNTVNGVKFDERGFGGSRRLSIRGSILRSPFGVRNIKLYWNGIVLNSPDGTAPIEILDFEELSSLQVIKGPMNSLYGANTGGVILTETIASSPEKISYSMDVGSYGFYRQKLVFNDTLKNGLLRVGLSNQRLDGYRKQEANEKSLLNIQYHNASLPNYEYGIYGTLYRGYWELPGSLNAQESNIPQSASAYSIAHNAYVRKAQASIGFTNKVYFNKSYLEASTSIYYSEKENPYGTSRFFQGYKLEDSRGANLRVVYVSIFELAENLDLKASIGTEQLWEYSNFKEYFNDSGKVDRSKVKRQDADQLSSSSLFGELALRFHNTRIIYSPGIYQEKYTIEDNYDVDGDHSGTMVFQPKLRSRLELRTDFGILPVDMYAIASNAYSTPTIFEVEATTEGVNKDLKAEVGEMLELGLSHSNKLMGIKVSAYKIRLKDAILPQSDSNGREYFVNAGQTQQDGYEMSMHWNLPFSFIKNSKKPVLSMQAESNNYVFVEFSEDGDVYDGNTIPGIADYTLGASLEMDVHYRHQVLLSYKKFGESQLNNENSAQSKEYSLLDLTLQSTLWDKEKWKLQLRGTVNNVGNTSYTSFYQLNSPSERYYNPSAPRNYLLGLKLSLK